MNSLRLLLVFAFIGGLVGCKQQQTDTKLKPATTIKSSLEAIYINGDSIHYTDFGSGEPVIFVHGSLGDYRSWAAQVDTFALHHRTISYSRRYAQPNNQQTTDSSDYSVRIHAGDLAAFIKELKLGPVHLVGHSWGAFTALKTTIDHPELVQSLVLGEPPVHSLISNSKIGDSLLNNLEEYTFKPSASAFSENQNEKGISLFIGGVMADSSAYSKTPQFVKDRWNQNYIELKGLVINRSFITITKQEVKNLTTPILVIKGDRSPLFLQVIADTLNNLLPNSQLYTLKNSSHGLQSTNPKDFNIKVLEFIGEH